MDAVSFDAQPVGSHAVLMPHLPRLQLLPHLPRALYLQVTSRQPGLGRRFRLPRAHCGKEIGDGDNVIGQRD